MGWADHQATLGNPVWAGRWGIYRVNGGYGTNADAPSTMDAGVRQVIMELLDQQTGRLRGEVAASVNRKRVPALAFHVVGPVNGCVF